MKSPKKMNRTRTARHITVFKINWGWLEYISKSALGDASKYTFSTKNFLEFDYRTTASSVTRISLTSMFCIIIYVLVFIFYTLKKNFISFTSCLIRPAS
jgi:hypothetical protein